MDNAFSWGVDQLLACAVALARLLPCMVLVPMFCFQHLKGPLRYAVALAVALGPVPAIAVALHTDAQDWQWYQWLGLAAKEIALGLVMGVVLQTPFTLFTSLGALLDNQRGALAGGQLNPALGSDVTSLGELLREALIMVALVSGGMVHLIDLIWHSYQLWPPTLWYPPFAEQGFLAIVTVIAQSIQSAMMYALPFIALLVMLEAGLAVVGLYAPQLNVYLLAPPAKSLVGFIFLIAYLPLLLELGQGNLVATGERLIEILLLIKAP